MSQKHVLNSCKPLVSYLWNTGKQYSPRCDDAERWAILFAWRNLIEKFKITSDTHKTDSDNDGHVWVNFRAKV